MLCSECLDLMQLKYTLEGDYYICMSCNYVELILNNENNNELPIINNNNG
jgi:hypothetical protein